MILRNTNSKTCIANSSFDGECCCCCNRYTIVVDKLFVGYICMIFLNNEPIVNRLPNNGHSMCEMFEKVK